jgi:hypothetical protein
MYTLRKICTKESKSKTKKQGQTNHSVFIHEINDCRNLYMKLMIAETGSSPRPWQHER